MMGRDEGDAYVDALVVLEELVETDDDLAERLRRAANRAREKRVAENEVLRNAIPYSEAVKKAWAHLFGPHQIELSAHEDVVIKTGSIHPDYLTALARYAERERQIEYTERWLLKQDSVIVVRDQKYVQSAGLGAALAQHSELFSEDDAQQARRPGRKSTKLDAVKAYVSKEYPDGVPGTVSYKEITRAVGDVNERTVRRALGRK